MAELGFQLVETGLAQANGHVADHAGHGSADAVVVVAELLDHLGHAFGAFLVGAADGRELVDGLAVDAFEELQVLWVGGGGGVLGGRGVKVLVADGGDEGHDLDAVRQLEVLLGDGAGGDTT